jgi:hypothetical protein
MTETEYARKVGELDRLLNDPDVPMEPAKVWSLLAEIAQHDLADAGRPRGPVGPASGEARGADQELAVALRARDRALDQPRHAPAG